MSGRSCYRADRWLTALMLVVGVVGCDRTVAPHESAAAPRPVNARREPVTVLSPHGSLGVPSGSVDEKGRPVMIACATCHTTRPADANVKIGATLEKFHQGLVGKHGDLSCTSCHNATDGYATLRLADGKSVPHAEVMTLCAQCHGPQYRDYQHGAHGGMTGYWDLTKGGRVRNNCIHCHDPHAPKYPTVQPAHGPNDRFQAGGGHE